MHSASVRPRSRRPPFAWIVENHKAYAVGFSRVTCFPLTVPLQDPSADCPDFDLPVRIADPANADGELLLLGDGRAAVTRHTCPLVLAPLFRRSFWGRPPRAQAGTPEALFLTVSSLIASRTPGCVAGWPAGVG